MAAAAFTSKEETDIVLSCKINWLLFGETGAMWRKSNRNRLTFCKGERVLLSILLQNRMIDSIQDEILAIEDAMAREDYQNALSVRELACL